MNGAKRFAKTLINSINNYPCYHWLSLHKIRDGNERKVQILTPIVMQMFFLYQEALNYLFSLPCHYLERAELAYVNHMPRGLLSHIASQLLKPSSEYQKWFAM